LTPLELAEEFDRQAEERRMLRWKPDEVAWFIDAAACVRALVAERDAERSKWQGADNARAQAVMERDEWRRLYEEARGEAQAATSLHAIPVVALDPEADEAHLSALGRGM
jgi:hypothetical protein